MDGPILVAAELLPWLLIGLALGFCIYAVDVWARNHPPEDDDDFRDDLTGDTTDT
jgi:hypothetical protein